MSLYRWILAIFVVSMAIPQAHAYDEDTHFYSTYAMARYAGIKHEVASKIALSTQWMDESYISDPTSMLMLTVGGVHKRRLLHFPSWRRNLAMGTDVQRSVMGFEKFTAAHAGLATRLIDILGYDGDEESLKSLNIWTNTTPDNEFASEMLNEGLKERDLMKASAAIHTIEDSYAHSGNPAGAGHTIFWHWPDRPYESPQKYSQMVQSVMHALVAIRKLLPPQAIDTSLNTVGQQPNAYSNAQALAFGYFTKVAPVISRDMLFDKEYVTAVVRDYVQKMIKEHFLMLNDRQGEELVASLQIDGTFDTYTAIHRLLIRFYPDGTAKEGALRWRYFLGQMGRLAENSPTSLTNYLDQYEPDDLVARIVDQVLLFNVPHALGSGTGLRNEIENDEATPRKIEMQIRVAYMKQFIRNEFQIDIEMLPNNTKDEAGFGKEIRQEPAAAAALPVSPEPGVTYVTFNAAEKYHFDAMIFNYLLPHMGETELKEITAAMHAYNVSKGAGEAVAVGRVIAVALKYKKTYLSDVFNEHLDPHDDNFFYKKERRLQDYVDRKVVKDLLVADDFWILGSDGVVRPNSNIKTIVGKPIEKKLEPTPVPLTPVPAPPPAKRLFKSI